MAGLLLLFSNTLWSYAISGLPTNFLMLLLLLALYCLFRADRSMHPPEIPEAERAEDGRSAAPPPSTRAGVLILASAVLMGLCFLTRYLCAFLVVPLAIYAAAIMRGRRAGGWALLYGLVFLLVIAPWLVRNYRLSGSTLGIAKYQIAANAALSRSYHPNLEGVYSIRRLELDVPDPVQGSGDRRHQADWHGLFYLLLRSGVDVCLSSPRCCPPAAGGRGALAGAVFGMALVGSPGEPKGPAKSWGQSAGPVLPAGGGVWRGLFLPASGSNPISHPPRLGRPRSGYLRC